MWSCCIQEIQEVLYQGRGLCFLWQSRGFNCWLQQFILEVTAEMNGLLPVQTELSSCLYTNCVRVSYKSLLVFHNVLWGHLARNCQRYVPEHHDSLDKISGRWFIKHNLKEIDVNLATEMLSCVFNSQGSTVNRQCKRMRYAEKPLQHCDLCCSLLDFSFPAPLHFPFPTSALAPKFYNVKRLWSACFDEVDYSAKMGWQHLSFPLLLNK